MNNVISIYGQNYVVRASRQNKRSTPSLVLDIYDAETGEPSGVISRSFPGESLDINEDEVAVINLDNQSLADTMIQSGLAVDSGKSVRSEYGVYKVVKVNPFLLKAKIGSL